MVVVVDKGFDGLRHLLCIAEDATINGLLFEGPDEAFGDAVTLGLGHEGMADRQAPEGGLGVEMLAGVLASVIGPKDQAACSILAHTPEQVMEPLAQRLQGRKP